MEKCRLCKREVEQLTKHHLTPQSRGGKNGKTTMFCLACKDMVHVLFTNKELEREYDSVEKLLATDRIKKYVKWVRKQKGESVTIAKKKRKL